MPVGHGPSPHYAMTTAGDAPNEQRHQEMAPRADKGRGICAKHTPGAPKLKVESHVPNIRWRRPVLHRPHSAAATFTFVPARTAASLFTSPGLARRVSSPRLIGVRPKPMAIAGPSGQ